jgi:tetratricopeptide (TPR) repeat protein
MLTSVLLCLLAQGPGPGAEAAKDPSAALVTVIHFAADGSDVLRGNGFLIGPDGLLVSNYHVVAKAPWLGVQLASGDVYDQVQVVALDPLGDLAILKVPAFNTPFIALAPHPAQPGDAVLLVPRAAPDGGRAARPARVVSVQLPTPDLDILLVDVALDASTKGCPVLDPGGTLVAVTTLTYQGGPGTGAAVGARRIIDVLGRRIDRPLDLVDWGAWALRDDDSLRARLEGLRLKRRFPAPEIGAEKGLARRLEMALEFDPTDMSARLLLARAYLQERTYDKAMAQVELVLGRQPSSLEAAAVRGDVLVHTGAYDEARATYRDAVAKGLKVPHNYDRDRQGVIIGGAVHDHALGSCRGAIILAPVSNPQKTSLWEDSELRLADKESRENLAAYLRKKGVAVATE